MACCAFAAFILGQIVLAWQGLREMVTGKVAVVAPDAAVAWSPGLAVADSAPRRRLVPAFAAIALVICAEAGALAALGYGAARAAAYLPQAWANSPICRALAHTPSDAA